MAEGRFGIKDAISLGITLLREEKPRQALITDPIREAADRKRLKLAMEANVALIIKYTEYSGRENIKKLPADRVPIAAFLHRSSNTDAQIAAAELAEDLDLVIANWSTNTEDRLMKWGLRIAGNKNFSPISVALQGPAPATRTDERHWLNIADFDKLKEAMLVGHKVPLIAAQRRGFDWILYRNSGLAVPFLAQYSGQRWVLPVFVDIDYEAVQKGLVDDPRRVVRNLLPGGDKPSARVIVGEPMELELIPENEIDLVVRKFFRGENLPKDLDDRADRAFLEVRSQGDDIVMAIGRYLPPERQGVWADRIRTRYGSSA